MRIAMLADAYKPHISGITTYIELNKRLLEQAGQEVFVFTFGDETIEDDEPRIIRSPGMPLMDTGYHFSFRYSPKAKALLQTMDVIHVHHPFLSGRLALHYGRPLSIPIIFTNHTRYDLYAQAYLPGLPEELSATFLENYMPNFCAAVDLVISPSAGMAQVLRHFKVQAPIQVIPNGVDLSRFETATRSLTRASLGLKKNDLALIYTGRLAREKNLSFLLDAFNGVTQEIQNVHLIMVGNGPEREALQKQAAASAAPQRIHFIGAIDYNIIPDHLALCDVFVTASISEVHPLSIIEAMAAGLPALGIRSVGVGDTIRDGETGFLAPEELPAFTAKLTHLCLDAPLRAKMGQAARVASQTYDIRRTSQIMLEHYQRLSAARVTHQKGLGYQLRRLAERFRT